MTLRRTVVGAQGVRLAVFEQGPPDAPVVLLIHGYPDTHAVWDAVATELADRFRVVRYDVRGAGASDAPARVSDYRLELLTRDFWAVVAAVSAPSEERARSTANAGDERLREEQIAAVSPLDPVHVVAHDWGSVAAWEPVTDPGAHRRIASYTSIAGPSLDQFGFWIRERLAHRTRRDLAQLAAQLRRSWYVLAFQVPVIPPLMWRFVLGPRWQSLLASNERIRVAGHPAASIAHDGARGIRLYRANFLRGARPRQRRTTVPVQLVLAAHDAFLTAALADGVERWAPDLRRVTVESGHWPMLSDPGDVARLIADFTASVG